MDGVVCENADKDIKILNGKEKGTQVVLLKTTGAISKEKAVEAIGAKYDKFVVLNVKEGFPKLDAQDKKGQDKKGKKRKPQNKSKESREKAKS